MVGDGIEMNHSTGNSSQTQSAPLPTAPEIKQSDNDNSSSESNGISDKLLTTILKLSTKKTNGDNSMSIPKGEDKIEQKLNDLIIKLSNSPDSNDKDSNNFDKNEILSILKLSLVKIQQLKLSLSFVKSNDISKMERLELERDLMLKEIEFIKNRQSTQQPHDLTTSPISLSTSRSQTIRSPETATNSNNNSFDSSQLSESHFPKLHNMTPNRHLYTIQQPPQPQSQSQSQSQSRQIKIVNVTKLSSPSNSKHQYQQTSPSYSSSTHGVSLSRRSSGSSNMSTPQSSTSVVTVTGTNTHATSPSRKRKDQPQFFHYYTNGLIDNDRNSIDNRRNKKKKIDEENEESVGDVGGEKVETLNDEKRPKEIAKDEKQVHKGKEDIIDDDDNDERRGDKEKK